SKVEELKAAAREEIARIEGMGGVRAAVESGYMKSQLVKSMSERVSRINADEQVIVGVNRWTEALPSPLVNDAEGGIFSVDPAEVQRATEALETTRRTRDNGRARAAIEALQDAARSGANMMEASIECALARVTTGEWGDALREV